LGEGIEKKSIRRGALQGNVRHNRKKHGGRKSSRGEHT